jgi:response regulator RpfG family c-di-GMP phosphodiesterase
MNYKILIVDDELPNIRLLERLFGQEYYCLTATSGEDAITLLDQHEVAVIISDQRMPHMTGIELLKKSADRRPHMVRILLTGYTDVEALVEAVNCGLVYMYVSKPWNNEDLRLRVSRAVEHYEQNKQQHALVAANDRLSARIKEMKLAFVRSISGILRMQDEFTYARGARVSRYATVIGENLALHEDLLDDLSAAGFLHELGVLGTPDEVVSKPRTNPSLSIAAKAPDRAAQVLSCFPELRDVADVIRFQRENFDGSGYPIGLIGDQIPIASRILRVASEYDALTKPRDAQGISHSAAVAKLQQGTKRAFDNEVIQALVNLSVEKMSSSKEVPTAPARPELITVSIN